MSIFEKLFAFKNSTCDHLLWKLRMEIIGIVTAQMTDRQQLLKIRKLVEGCGKPLTESATRTEG
jgi:hypothetical protein